MKPLFENAQTFTAYATVDAGNFMLRKLMQEMDKPILPSEAKSGYKKRIEHIVQAIIIVKDILSAKKTIEVDYAREETLLNELETQLKIATKQ